MWQRPLGDSGGSPVVMFGYPAAKWMVDAIPTAVEPNFTIELYAKTSPQYLSSMDEPPLTNTTARTIFLLTVMQVYEKLTPLWTLESLTFFEFLETSLRTVLAKWTDQDLSEIARFRDLMEIANDGVFLHVVQDLLHELFTKATQVMADEVNVELQYFQLADSIGYTALTLTIPVRPLDGVEDSQTISAAESSSKNGGYLRNVTDVFGEAWSRMNPLVHAGSFKLELASEWEMVLVSLGKRLHGETMDVNTTVGSHGAIIVSGLRTTYSLTVGLLSHTIEDLAEALGAECEDYVCYGIRAATPSLARQNSLLLVSRSALLDVELPDTVYLNAAVRWFKTGYINWKRLAKVDKSPPILLPRNFEYVTQEAVDYLSSYHFCDSWVEEQSRFVEVNHLYAEHSLQMSYTAGLHYLMQDAVLHSVDDAQMTVNLYGNYHDTYVQVSIPRFNLLLSLAGCGVLVVGMIVTGITNKRGALIIGSKSDDSGIADALLNHRKFPRSVLSLSVVRAGDSSTVNLDDLHLQSATFIEHTKEKKPLVSPLLRKGAIIQAVQRKLAKPRSPQQ